MLETCVWQRMLLHPRQHLSAGRRINHTTKTLSQTINNKIIQYARLLIKQCAVKRLINIQFGNIVSHQSTQKRFSLSTLHINNGHMRYIKHPCIAAHRRMFFNLRAVIHGHQPACKVHHFAAAIHMLLIQRGFRCCLVIRHCLLHLIY